MSMSDTRRRGVGRHLAPRLAEIDEALDYLDEAGWILEKKIITDEDGEPLRAYFRVHWGPVRDEDVL
jgi:hypothetical protein